MRLLKIKAILNMLSLHGIRVLVVASAMLGSTLVLYSGYSIYEQVYTENRAFSSGNLAYDQGASIEEAQETLVETREDYRAWIKMNDTHIDYPVMQGKDDLYYASHDIDKKSSLTGAIYMASGNSPDVSDNYIVLYGHHMDNGAMFGDLDRFQTKAFFNSHRKGVFVTPNGSYEVNAIAVISTDAYEDMIYAAGTRNLKEILAFADAHATVKDIPDAAGVTRLIALSTCADARTNGRLVLLGTLTKIEPTPTPTEDPVITKQQDVTPVPTEEPDITPEPTEEPTPEPVVTEEPTPVPTVTEAPATPTPTAAPTQVPDDGGETRQKGRTFLDWLRDFFTPGGSSYGEEVWALLNLICLAVTIYITVPILRLRSKFGRIGKMREINEAGAKTGATPYDVGKFTRRFIIGVSIEAVISVVALITYILTQNMRLPMVLIDRWTPLMLGLLIGALVTEILLTNPGKGNRAK